MTRTDSKITSFSIQFNPNNYKNLFVDELDTLSNKATNFFRFVRAFGSKLKLGDFVNTCMVEDRTQKLNSVT